MNSVVLTGRLTKDLDLKKLPSGKSVVKFTLAVNRKYAKDGELQADFINCVAWGQSADFLSNYTKKGDMIGVKGRITTGSYEGKNGKVYTTEVSCEEVEILNKKNMNLDEPKQEQEKVYQTSLNGNEDALGYKNNIVIDSDELPFY